MIANRVAGHLAPLLLAGGLAIGLAAGGSPAQAENRLADTASDYLRDHADNPVDWYPWGEEALQLARERDVPVFVSVGYSTCFWCHVAERELYEDPAIARVMNEGFVNIKVDREQRPDLDRVLMAATRALGEGGGWPNNVFLTPDLEPFFAGSYFPPEPLPGRESFPQILERLSARWQEDRAALLARADEAAEALRDGSGGGLAPERIDPERWRDAAIEALEGEFDPLVGGFAPPGQSSRFPQSPRLALLLSALDDEPGGPAAEMLDQTLAAMSIGALFDHVGGGFHRYTVDPEWAIPHFEKMLVDNAQLVGLYARAGQRLDRPWFGAVAERTGDYLERRLWSEAGGFFTAENAEVDGIEGRSYVFTRAEIREVLGDEAEAFLDWHELVALPESRVDHELPDGGAVNLSVGRAFDAFEDRELAAVTGELASSYAALRAYRVARGDQPSRDRKRVAEFNALAGLGLLAAAQSRDRADWQERAVAVGDWLWETLRDESTGRLRRQVYEGEVSGEAFLSDHAAAGRLMLALHGAQHDLRWLFRAQRIAQVIETHYLDEDGRLHERPPQAGGGLPLAPPLAGDDVVPSGHSQAVVFLLDLARLLDAPAMERRAVRALAGFAGEVDARPADWGWLVGELARPSRAERVSRLAAELAAEAADAGGPGASRDHVAVEARLVEDGAAIEVRLVIEAGFHVNANPASEDFLVPTRITAVDGEIGRIDYPEGKPFSAGFARSSIDVYEGELTLRAPVTGKVPTRLAVDLQACDDQVCLAPDEVEVEVSRGGE